MSAANGAALAHPPHISFLLQTFHLLYMKRDTPSKYCSRFPFPPFLSRNITIATEVNHWYYSECSSIASFGHCPYLDQSCRLFLAIHIIYFSPFSSNICGASLPFRFTVPMFPDIPLTRRTTVRRLKYSQRFFLPLQASRYISSSSRRTAVSLWFLL